MSYSRKQKEMQEFIMHGTKEVLKDLGITLEEFKDLNLKYEESNPNFLEYE